MVGRNVHPLKCGVEDHALTVKRTASTTPLRRPAPGTVRAFTLVALESVVGAGAVDAPDVGPRLPVNNRLLRALLFQGC